MKNNIYSYDKCKGLSHSFFVEEPTDISYGSLFPLKDTFRLSNISNIQYYQVQNRRYLGNKYKLLDFIEEILSKRCKQFDSFCDIFAGTGVVGERFNKTRIRVISNDILNSNFVGLSTFLGTSSDIQIISKIKHLNSLDANDDNYFSVHFGGRYFSKQNARKIGVIREEIDKIVDCEDERNILISSLLYATDKVANTVGHYDAYRKTLDMVKPVELQIPRINWVVNEVNEVYNEDANKLIRKISSDVLYIDPPYNSRQYSDAYHLLENLSEWKKPEVFGIGRKMDRSHIKSKYCLRNATFAFEDLIKNANCKHILMSYNNTGESKDGRSNAKISDDEILRILKAKGEVEIFEKKYQAFTTGKSNGIGHTERVFYCNVNK